MEVNGKGVMETTGMSRRLFLSQRVSRRVHSNKTDSSIQHESPLGRMKGRLRTLPTWLYLTRYEQVLVGGMRDVSR